MVLKEIEYDYCLVGAGTSGLYLAYKLTQAGKRVALIELGDQTPLYGSEFEEDINFVKDKYKGTSSGRAFGFGGTSVLWGGQLISLSEFDFCRRDWVGNGEWPITLNDLRPYFDDVEDVLGFNFSGLLQGKSDESTIDNFYNNFKSVKAFNLRLSSWIPFKSRNFYLKFKDLFDSELLTVFKNVHVRGENFVVNSDNFIHEVNFVNNDEYFKVKAKDFIISAGVVNSTKLFLEFINSNSLNEIIEKDIAGNYFSDHLSTSIASIRIDSKLREQFLPIFSKSIMRTPRFELNFDKQKELVLPSAFAHFTFTGDRLSGFDFIRDILRSLQGENRIKPNLLSLFNFNNIRDIFLMVKYRFWNKRLWFPDDFNINVLLDIEQISLKENSIKLKLSDKLDISWDVSLSDLENINKVGDLFLNELMKLLGNDINIKSNLPITMEDLSNIYDVYHPTGTLRMGNRSSDSIVNSNLQVWEIPNLYLLGTSIFPTAGSANPGLVQLALSSRLSKFLIEKQGE
jgi:hypothetical protein